MQELFEENQGIAMHIDDILNDCEGKRKRERQQKAAEMCQEMGHGKTNLI